MHLTVGAHTGFFQQLGLRRSCPVYLCKPVTVSRIVTSYQVPYHVVVTFTTSPFPIRPLKRPLIALLSLPYSRGLCEECLVATVVILGVFPMPGEREPCLYERLETLTVCQPSLGSKVYSLPNEWALAYLSFVGVECFWSLGRYEANATQREASITPTMAHRDEYRPMMSNCTWKTFV
jgi:hypothetical protein